MPVREKLGTGGYLVVAVLNPRVGAGAPGIVRASVEEGHDVGLHGGRNHGRWQASAMSWTEERLLDEVRYGLRCFEAAAETRPHGFASPGWEGPSGLGPILSRLGFEYVADAHGPEGRIGWADTAADLVSVPTRLTGEPDGVAYLEWCRARGLDQERILEQFERDLDVAGESVVMYDHPYHAGLHEVGTLRRMLRIARSRGFEISTLRSLASSFRAEA